MTFDLARSRRYWRHAPSGAGKHDIEGMLGLAEAEMVRVWDDAFLRRFGTYAEEDEFLARLGEEFHGKRVLSIGTGLGLHEIYYAAHGARITCCDIVPTNMEVIRRVAASKGLRFDDFILSEGPQQAFEPASFDVVFVYGSLMAAPEAYQIEMLRQFKAALKPGGRIILMLYTWEFAAANCGWFDPEEFDPLVFARVTDPSVGEEDCPWSDWHDAAKLERLSGWPVTREQEWNQAWFVWFELMERGNGGPRPFFDRMDMGREVTRFDLSKFSPAAASISLDQEGLHVQTEVQQYGYAAAGEAERCNEGNAILVDATLVDGSFSAGLLDLERDEFALARSIWQPGRSVQLFAAPYVPAEFRLIFSNFRTQGPASSEFIVHGASLVDRASASQQFIVARREGSEA